MLSEYAVDPKALGADWRVFKDLFDRFGGDKGRLISRFPKKWESKVIQAAKEASMPDVRMKSLVERLRRGKYRIADFERIYEAESSWMENAIRLHAERPFHAIVHDCEPAPCPEALLVDDCTDDAPLFHAPISQDVVRTEDEIAGALFMLVLAASEIDLVDPYFDLRPGQRNYIGPLRQLLERLGNASSSPRTIRVHFRTHHTRPPSNILLNDTVRLTAGILPEGYCLELHEWEQIDGGEDFHDRFCLTNLGGIMIGAGLSAQGASETATFTLLDLDHSQRIRLKFTDASGTFRKAGQTVLIRSDGTGMLI